ncbi:MAG: phage holin family protein [Marinilabiliales bacterium]|nr:phage holin family protein [Marinilabiliales bacterium]
MEKDSTGYFHELKELLTEYLTARVKLFKLEVYEKTAKISATLFTSLAIGLLASLMFFFLSLALGFYLGSLLNSFGTGFLIIALFYLIPLVLLLIYRKRWIEKRIIDNVIEQLMEKEEEDNDE